MSEQQVRKGKAAQLDFAFEVPRTLEFSSDETQIPPAPAEVRRGLPGEFWNGMIWVSDEDVPF